MKTASKVETVSGTLLTMVPHKQLVGFGAIFVVASLIGFLNAANSRSPWYFRYIAFAIGIISLVLGILLPIRLWNM
jgi:uncharacterized membrane protein YczE